MFRLSLRDCLNNHRCFNFSNRKNVQIVHVSIRWRYKYKNSTDPEIVKFLGNLLGIDRSNALKILQNYSGYKKFHQGEIARTHAILVKYGIIDEVLSVLPTILFHKPYLLEQRIHVYKDIGCTRIKVPMLIPFHANIHLKVEELKEREIIPADADVTKNFLNCLHEQPPDVPVLESYPDNHTVANIHQNVYRHYLRWRFKFTEEQIERIVVSKMRMRFQSFTLLRQMVDILENEFGFHGERLRRNSYLFCKSPSNTREILNEIRYIGDTDTKSVILRYPRILNVTVDMMHEKTKLLKEFNIRDETISRCPDIFTLATNTIRQRLIEYQSMKDLHGHFTHPRFLMLIFYLRGVKRRLHILKQLNVRCASLHILTTSDKAFQRYIMVGSDRTKGKDSMRLLSFEFGFHVTDPELAVLKRHPLWCQIPCLHIHECYEFLRESNFPKEAILTNLQIVLYRRTQIEKELKNIDSMKLDPSWELTPSRKLSLCLYYIEKKYHFDGNGIWNCQENQGESVRSGVEEIHPWQIMRQEIRM